MREIPFEKKQRFDKYMALLEGQNQATIRYLAGATGVSEAAVLKDLQEMQGHEYFPDEAYIDYKKNCLVLKNEVAGTRAAPAGAKPKVSAKSPGKKSDGKRTAGIILMIIGLIVLVGTVDGFIEGQALYMSLEEILIGSMMSLGGSLLFVRSQRERKTEQLCAQIRLCISSEEPISVTDLSAHCGARPGDVRNALQSMLRSGTLSPKAVFYPKTDMFYPVGVPEKPAQPPKRETDSPKRQETEFEKIISEIRQLNVEILDEAVSAKIDRIEEVTGKIFKLVEEVPAKRDRIHSFMNYYLPSTLKLLHSYSMLERQGIDGENIAEAKGRIENILDKLAAGFEQQLDQLFREDALDISADVQVLETMMKRDGLTEEKFGI